MGFTQEFNAFVKVDASQVQTTNNAVFEEMERTITDFINQTFWTKDEFEPEERINCGLSIQISQQNSQNSYSATAQFQALRPIYGTDYESNVLNYIDKDFQFTFNEGQDLIYNETGFNTNLVSVISFYVHIMLGMDYDTYSKLGGSPYLDKARDILNRAQSVTPNGWQQEDGTNGKYWLIDNLLNPQFISFREGQYIYYREAFDNFTQNPQEAQDKMIGTIDELKKIRELAPASVLIKSYFTAKENEFIQLFKGADQQTKTKAMNALIAADPTHQENYRTIMSR